MAHIISDAVAGPFHALYTGPTATPYASGITSATLGVIGEKGIRQIRTFEGEEYSGDVLGASIVEGVYLGGQMFLEFELEEADLTNVKSLMNPSRTGAHGTADAAGYVGVPGTFMTEFAGSLVLEPLYTGTAQLHTTAGQQTTPVRTYGLVTIAAGFQMEQLLGSRRRIIPIRLRCFPYSDAGSPAKYIWYSVSAISGTYNVV